MVLNIGNRAALIGKTLECVYNGKARKGKIVGVANGNITIEYSQGGKLEYRCFDVRKMLGTIVY